MLVTLKEILAIAEEKKCAIGSFNTPSLAPIRAVIGAAEVLSQPVIMMHAQVHEEMGLCKMEEIIPIMRMYAQRAKVPVCVHLDHGTDLDYVEKGLALGCTGVMYDGSNLSEEENLENTKRAVEMAKRVGASVEAEIGSMGAREGGGEGGASIYTDPQAAKAFAEETGIDALACAFGTAHGIYLSEPKLDFDRLAKIKSLVNIPLVMHGGSGVSHEDYQKVIALGIRKINYYSYMAKAGAAAANLAAAENKLFFHDMELYALAAMEKDVKEALGVFMG